MSEEREIRRRAFDKFRPRSLLETKLEGLLRLQAGELPGQLAAQYRYLTRLRDRLSNNNVLRSYAGGELGGSEQVSAVAIDWATHPLYGGRAYTAVAALRSTHVEGLKLTPGPRNLVGDAGEISGGPGDPRLRWRAGLLALRVLEPLLDQAPIPGLVVFSPFLPVAPDEPRNAKTPIQDEWDQTRRGVDRFLDQHQAKLRRQRTAGIRLCSFGRVPFDTVPSRTLAAYGEGLEHLDDEIRASISDEASRLDRIPADRVFDVLIQRGVRTRARAIDSGPWPRIQFVTRTSAQGPSFLVDVFGSSEAWNTDSLDRLCRRLAHLASLGGLSGWPVPLNTARQDTHGLGELAQLLAHETVGEVERAAEIDDRRTIARLRQEVQAERTDPST